MFQLFDLVEKSAKIFAANIDKPNAPMMYPESKVNTVINPYCEDKLIHVKFVKIRQSSLYPSKRCASEESTKRPNETNQERKQDIKNLTIDR